MVSEPEDDCADFRIFSARCPSGSKKNSVSYESSNGTIRYRFTLGEVLSWNIDAEVIVGNGWTRITLREIPRFLVDALDFISARGFNIDGIFRKEGNSARLNRPEIQEVYRGMLPIPSDFTVLDVCTMVKRFLKDLKPTLLNSDDVRMNIIRMAKKARLSGDYQLTHMEMIEIFESTPRQLPSSHLGTLGYVMRILNRIVKHSDTHKMTTDNLAVVLVGSVFGDYMAGGGTESRKKMQQAKKCTEAELNAKKEDMGVQVAAVKLLLVNANLIGLPHGHYVSSSRLHLNNPLNIRSTSAMPNIRCASVSENELTSSTSSRGTHIFSMSKASMMHQNYPTQNPLRPTLSRRDSDLTHVKLLKQRDSGTKRSSSFLPIPSLRGLRDKVSNQFLKRNKSPSPDKIRRHMFKPLAVPSSFSPFFSSSSANLPPPPPPPMQETPLIIKRTVSVFDSDIEDVKQGDSNRNIQKNESTSSGRKSRTHTKRGNINSELRDGLDSDSQCSFHLSPIPAEKRSSLSSSSSTITNRSLRRFSQSEQNSFIRGDETPPKKKKSEIRSGLTRRNTADCFQNEHHRRSRRPSRRSTFWGEVIAEEKENHSSFAAMDDQWSDDEYVMEKSEMEDTIGVGESVLEIMNNQARSRRLRVAERRQRRLEDNSKNSESMMALNGSIAIVDKLTSPSRDVKYLSNSKSHMESQQDMTVLEKTPITTGGLRTPSTRFSSKSKIGQQIEREMKQRLDVVATPMISRRTASEPVGQQSHSKLPGRAPSAIPLRKLDSIGCQQNGHVWVGKTLTVVPSPMLKSRVEKTNEDEKVSPILARSPLFRSSSTAPPTENKLSPFFGFRSKSQFTDERVSSKDFAALATPPRGRRVHSRSGRIPQSNLIYSSPPMKPIETQHDKGGNSNDALRSSSPIVNQSSSNLTGNRLNIETHAPFDQKIGSANDAPVFKFPFLPPMKSHESKERKNNISSARISPTPRSSSHSSEDQSGEFGESNLFGDYNELLKHSTEDTQFPHQPVAARPSVTALRNSACGLVQSRINHFQLIEQINISQYRAPSDMPSGRPSACSLTLSKSIDAISSSGKL